MSLLGDAAGAAGDAVNTVAGKDSTLGGLVDKLTGAVAGQDAKDAPGNAAFLDGGPIDDPTAAPSFAGKPFIPGAAGLPVALQLTKPLQFLHLGSAHDDKADPFPGDLLARGVAFRDALVRESVLLYSFAQGAVSVLQAKEQTQGAAGKMLGAASSALGTASSLMGGGDKPPPAPSGPEAFTPVLAQIRAAADLVNLEAFDYPAVHTAGLALSKAGDAYNETCKTAAALPPPGSDKGGSGIPGMGSGGLGSVPGLSAVGGALGGLAGPLGSAGGFVSQIPGWLFKVQDAYLAMYSASRNTYEWLIIRQCHDYSLQAIRKQWQPTYDIWRQRSKDATDAAQQGNQSLAESQLDSMKNQLSQPVINSASATDTKQGRDAAQGLDDAQQAVKDVRTSGEDKAQKLVGLLDTENPQAGMPPEAVAALDAIFKLFEGDPQASPPLKPFHEIMSDALGGALMGYKNDDVNQPNPLPGPVPTFIEYVSKATLVVLHKIYCYLHPERGMPSAALVLAATHNAIASTLVDLIYKLILGKDRKDNDTKQQKQDAKSAVDKVGQADFGGALSAAQSAAPSLDQGENKLADLMTQFLESQGHYLDGIIMFIAVEIWQELNAAWFESSLKNADTLEMYIGRLPMLASMMLRDMIFPIFQLVMMAMGAGNHLADMVWTPVDDGVKDVKYFSKMVKKKKDEVVQRGKDIKQAGKNVDQKISDVTGALGTDVTNLLSGGDLTDPSVIGSEIANANKLAQDAGAAPGQIVKAGELPDHPDDQQKAKNLGWGPMSALRIEKGTAAKVTGSQIDSAGRETPIEEEALLKARNKPAAAPAAGGGGGGSPLSAAAGALGL